MPEEKRMSDEQFERFALQECKHPEIVAECKRARKAEKRLEGENKELKAKIKEIIECLK